MALCVVVAAANGGSRPWESDGANLTDYPE